MNAPNPQSSSLGSGAMGLGPSSGSSVVASSSWLGTWWSPAERNMEARYTRCASALPTDRGG